jgi:PPOX class probable F420-dependent enzyme
MSDLNTPDVRALLDAPTYAVLSTINADGSILSNVVWLDSGDGTVTVNSAVGRKWPTNLDRDPHVTVLLMPADNPYMFVEIRGTAIGQTDGADEHIDGLAKKYLGQDTYPFRQPGEQRITYVITPDVVRLVKQG